MAPSARPPTEDADTSVLSVATASTEGDQLISYGAPSDAGDVDEIVEGDSVLFRSASSSEDDDDDEDELEDEDEDEESLGSVDTETEDDDSRDSEDAYSDVDREDDDPVGDTSYAPSDSDSVPSASASEDEDEDGEEAGEGESSVDLEWEEAKEMAGCAVRAHTRVLKAAAAEGMSVAQAKTVSGVVDVVRALVNTVGAFEVSSLPMLPRYLVRLMYGRIALQEGPVNADFVLAQLQEYETILLNEDREFAFDGQKDLINKYLALVKYTPTPDAASLDAAFVAEGVRDEDGAIDLRALVREMKRRFAETAQ